MKALITGATGFIGRHLITRLSSLGRELRCVARPMSDTTALLGKPNIELVSADLWNKSSVMDVVQDVDVVYHLAIDYSRPTTEDVRNLLEACLSIGVRRFVYFSSIAATGLSKVSDPITEDTPCKPDTDYGKLKLAAERMLLEAHAEHRLPVVIIRPTSVYGIGETNFWLPLFRAIHGGRLSRLFGDGSNLLSLCFIDNLIEGAMLAEEREAAIGQVYIISDRTPYALQNVVAVMADACGVELPRSSIPRPLALPVARALDYLSRLELAQPIVPFLPSNVARWIAHYPCAITKARAQLGFEPIVDLMDGVQRTVEWYRRNGYLFHSLPWSDGALDMESLPQPSNSWPERTVSAGGRAVQLAWNVAALTWRLPPKVARRIRRGIGWRRT